MAFFIAVLTEAEVVVGLWCNRKLARSFYCFSTKIRSSATYPLKSKLRWNNYGWIEIRSVPERNPRFCAAVYFTRSQWTRVDINFLVSPKRETYHYLSLFVSHFTYLWKMGSNVILRPSITFLEVDWIKMSVEIVISSLKILFDFKQWICKNVDLIIWFVVIKFMLPEVDDIDSI